MRTGTVHIMTNRPNGTLYLGVTSNLGLRACQHRTGALPGFTKTYRLIRLVWYEHHELITTAIQRERTMKHWSRALKVRLILDLTRGRFEPGAGRSRNVPAWVAGTSPAVTAESGQPKQTRHFR